MAAFQRLIFKPWFPSAPVAQAKIVLYHYCFARAFCGLTFAPVSGSKCPAGTSGKEGCGQEPLTRPILDSF